VILMSNRADASTTWTKEVMTAAQNPFFQFDDLNTGATQTVQFLADFEGNDFTSDLYMVEGGAPASIKQLTHFNPPGSTSRQVVPEFYWNANYTQLLWTVESSNAANIASYTGSFSVNLAPASTTPPWITAHEQPISMLRVGAQAQVPTQLGPLSNVSVAVTAPANPAAPLQHASQNNDTQSAPVVATTYIAPWQTDLTVLGTESLQNLALPGLARLVGL